MINPLQAATQGLIGTNLNPLGIAVQGLLITAHGALQAPLRSVQFTVYMTTEMKFHVIA